MFLFTFLLCDCIIEVCVIYTAEKTMQICEKSFYISNALDEIKTDDSWSTYEIKILILILQELSNYRVYVKKEKKGESIDSDAFKKELEVAPNVYKFDKKSIQEVTRISNANFARDIKKTCKSMMKKIIDTPNPLDINNHTTGHLVI